MEKTKLISLLKTFTAEEVEEFEHFLSSPLFNKRDSLIPLFKWIKRYFPAFDQEDFTKENLYESIYNNSGYNDELIRILFSRLYNVLEKYLAYMNFKNDKYYQKLELLSQLNKRGLEKQFNISYKKVKDEIYGEKVININILRQKNRLARLNRIHRDTFRKSTFFEENVLYERESNLIEYFLVDIITVYCMMLNEMQFIPERKYELSMLTGIKDYIEKNYEKIKANFYLLIYYYLLMLLAEPKQIYYDNLKALLNKYSSNLAHREKINLYTGMHNYLEDRIYEGDVTAVKLNFELYKESFLNGGMLKPTGFINNYGLMNAVNSSLSVKDPGQAAEFLNDFGDKIEGYYKESTINYCNALIKYYYSDFDEALKYLSKVNYDDIMYKISVKSLTLMIYFSMNEREGFYFAAESFRHFLKENKLIGKNYEIYYNNFINFTVKLYRGVENKEKYDLFSFRKELTESKNLAKKHWLLQQLGIIEKSVNNSI